VSRSCALAAGECGWNTLDRSRNGGIATIDALIPRVTLVRPRAQVDLTAKRTETGEDYMKLTQGKGYVSSEGFGRVVPGSRLGSWA
jgi:hypothetical protein